MGFLFVLIGVIIGAIVGAGAGIYFSSKPSKFSFRDISSSFKKEQTKIMATLTEKKNTFEKELEDEKDLKQKEISEKMAVIERNFNENLAAAERSLAALQSQHEKQKEALEEQFNQEAAARQSQLIEQIQSEEEKKHQAIDRLAADYKEKTEELKSEFKKFEADYKEKRQSYQELLEKQERHQEEVIERFKKDEARRQDLDFYRIQLSEADLEDIKRLKTVAASLNSPQVLYKLIWENYYKSKFSELVGRVVGKSRGCGIYKITNIFNEKVYIGQTRQTYSDRWRSHVKRGLKAEPATNNKLYNAMWEDGVENFTFEVLCDCKVEELNEKERYFIKFYKSDEWGFNTNKGVATSRGSTES